MTTTDTARIRELNDAFRCDPNVIGVQLALGMLVVTRGVAARGNAGNNLGPAVGLRADATQLSRARW
jgi:hypothetical protein